MTYDRPISNYSPLWFREINEMERDICDPPPETSVSEGVHPIEEVREEITCAAFTPMDSYPIRASAGRKELESTPFLMAIKRQAG